MTETFFNHNITTYYQDYLSAYVFCGNLIYSVVEETLLDLGVVFNATSNLSTKLASDAWTTVSSGVYDYLNSFVMEAIPQNPVYYHDRSVILYIALISLIFLFYIFHRFVLTDPDEGHLIRQDRVDLYEREDEEAEIEEVLQDIEDIEPLDTTVKLGMAENLELNTLHSRYKTLIEQWTDLAKTRHRDGMSVNFEVQIGQNYWKLRGLFVFLLFFTCIFTMFFLRGVPKQNWGDRFVSSAMENAVRRACFEGENWSDYLEKLAGLEPIVCETPDLIYLYAIDFDRYVKETFSFYLPNWNFDFVVSALFYTLVIIWSLLIFFTIPGWVYFKVDIYNTPLSVDMSPDALS